MKGFVLLVTWFVPGMPPNSYQTAFDSANACQIARMAVHSEGRRIMAEYMQRADAATGSQGQPASFLALEMAPAVTAVCVRQ
jgi:hypothetical protein